MDVRLTLVITLLCGTALAGCVEEPQAIALSAVDAEPDPDPLDAEPVDDAPDDAEAPVEDETPAPNTTEEDLPPAPAPPVPSLNVSLDGQYAPLPVNVTVDASDDNGDLVSWSLVVGNRTVNGTDFPSVVAHTFEEPGSYNVTLRVVDGANHTANATQQVVVAANPFPWTASALNAVSCAGCLGSESAAECGGWTAGVNGIDCVWFELPPGSAGHAYTASSDFPLNDPDGQFFADCTHGSAHVGDAYSVGVETGTVPEGAGCMVLWEFVGGGSTITLRID